MRPVRPKPVATSSSDQQDVVAVAQLAHAAQVALRVHEHPGGALHERLHDHRRHLARVVARAARSMAARSPGSALSGVEQQRAVERVEQVDPADRDRADRVAVVGHPRARRSGAPLLAALAPVLERHLERDLGGRGAGVRVEDAREPGRRELDQPPRQLDRRPVAEAEHRGVGDAVELGAHGGVDPRVARGRARCTRATRRRRCSAARRRRSGRCPRRARRSAAPPRSSRAAG